MISDGGLGNQPQEQNARSTGKSTGSVRAMFVTFSKKFFAQDPFIMSIISAFKPQPLTCDLPWFDLCTMQLEIMEKNLVWKLSLRKYKTTKRLLLLLLVPGDKWWLSHSPYSPFYTHYNLLMHAFLELLAFVMHPTLPTLHSKLIPNFLFKVFFRQNRFRSKKIFCCLNSKSVLT